MNAQPTAMQIFKALGTLVVPRNWLGQGCKAFPAIPTSEFSHMLSAPFSI
jgi:hypothetical protein